ncbi:L-type lectin-domain containing receptor kinase IX.1-like [Arachis ipaensis]|uniref:L-type lectin-domain containing receptor kinase IX.1-like n=1 Tax=Arachis ipaensis TaxID=130454 RepID=UPI0007AF810E|nr:L-type lectin-domain containing receptor kinase IX.1-like [Arachis ipaensis]XP_025659903.1 L-type lectin-domain containing receptor kinase IX.1-like [Arachis hypogaea]
MLATLVCFHLHNCTMVSSLLLLLLTIFPSNVDPLHFNIINFSSVENARKDMAYEGDAKVANNGFIELTSYDFYRTGRTIYGQPFHLWDSSTKVLTDFTTSFTFTIHGSESNSSVLADGFAFHMAPLSFTTPPNSAGGNFGLFNLSTHFGIPQNQMFMVEFDTYQNKDYDPLDLEQHVGINKNSLKSINYTKFDIEGNNGKQGHALITYNSSTKNLLVSWSFDGASTHTLSCEIDLSEILPEYVTVGFSAATGRRSKTQHNIHSWEFNSTLDSTDSEVNRKKRQKRIIEIVAMTCSIIVLVLMVCVCLIKKRIAKLLHDDGNSRYKVVANDLDEASLPRRFEYKELAQATNEFSNDRKLGSGGSSQVYKGFLSHSGRAVAVKRIFADIQGGEKIFINEVKIISRLIHRNLVQFIGWCHNKQEFFLVFEYMPNGSLDTHLFGNRRALPWDARYKIALGVATALHYLHEDAEQCVLHRDIKSANILLDTDFSTKLCDFGMAKLVDPRLKTQRTGVVGTYGYLAPEYLNGGRASKESDIYSFGIVALEIACGRKTYQDGEYHIPLVKWVWQLYVEGNILNVADEGLNKNFDELQMTCLLIVGLWCTNPNAKERPKAAQVIKVLQLESPLPALPHDMHDHPLQPTMENFRNSSQSSPITNSLVNDGR